MGKINIGRWLLGGLAAGVLTWVMEGASSVLYMQDMQNALQAHGMSMDMTPASWLLTVVASLLYGWTAIFFYAAARPRFGPGPGTALRVAVPFWVAASLLSILGYHMMGLFPAPMLLLWAAISLAEAILATLLGAWIYREA